MSSGCPIPSNPDIAGIGVRIAIYVQNLLCFVPAVWAIWDGEVSDYELESIETQSTTNLILAFALLISCVVQAFTLGLTNYHASIVLSMSWTNNTNAFIYFLLYVHYKGQAGPGRSPVKPEWSAWLAHVKIAGGSRGDAPPYVSFREGGVQKQRQGKRAATKMVFRRIALFLGSLHLTVMAALGLWLWSDPSSFGSYDSSCATEFANIAVLGARVPFGSDPLRIFSLVIYALFLLPGFNLLLPMTAFLSLFLWHHARQRRKADASLSSDSLVSSPYPIVRNRMVMRLRAWYARCINSSVFPVCIGLGFLFAINVILIVDIELTLHRNRDLQASGEAEWGFGQVLAVLLLFMPLRDLLEMILARRQRRQEMQIREHEWREALHLGDVDKILALVKAGADPNVKAGDGLNALEVVTLSGNWELVQEIVTAGANVNTHFQSESYGTVLQAACATGSLHVVQFLLNAGAFPATTGGKHEETSLHTACFNDRKEIVQLLLERRVDPNVTDNKGRTPLHTAAGGEYVDCARYLLERGADPNILTMRGETPLHSACWTRSAEYVKVLLEFGADPNIGNGERGLTPLHIACWRASPKGVQYLLESGADHNIRDNKGETPLQLLRRLRPGKDSDIVQLLQQRGAVE